jgi:hypothetical protein
LTILLIQPLAVNLALQFRIKAVDGSKVSGVLHGTIHRVP